MNIAMKLWTRVLAILEKAVLPPAHHAPDYENVRYEFIMPELIVLDVKDSRARRSRT